MNKDLKMKTAFTLAEGATHVGIFHNTRRVAFTLAEVLITLGIIGIVSAMTIPTLINNYKEKVRDNQFKKVYATLNQALRMTVADFDYIPKCYYSNTGTYVSDCDIFWEKLREKLKVVKYCPEKAFANGCIPHYDGYEVILKENHKDDPDYDEQYWEDYAIYNMGSFTTYWIKNKNPAFTLNDGTVFIIYKTDKYLYPLFLIDINGHGGDNKWGYDLFMFKIEHNGKTFHFSGLGAVSKGGLRGYDLLKKLNLY